MRARRAAIARALGDDDGPTTVEYALLLALILLMAIGAIRSLGGGAEGRWKLNGDKIRDAITDPGGAGR